MPSRTQGWLALRILSGTIWGAVLFLAGLRVGTLELTGRETVCKVLGVGLAALGLYVFSCVVADRLFPRADMRICGSVQFLLGTTLVGCGAYVAYFIAGIVLIKGS